MSYFQIKELVPQNSEADFNNILPAFLSIWNHSENHRFLSFTLQPFQKETASSWFKHHLDMGVRYFVAVSDDGGEILAMSTIKIDLIEGFEIIGLGVRPKAKKRGIGSSLIAHAISLAQDLGFKAVDSGLVADNFKMMRILIQFEFMPVKINHNARADGVDLVYMRKYL